MNIRVIRRFVHGVAGMLALATILTFWVATVLVELLGTPAAVAGVKTAIAWSLLLLVPLMAITAGSGLAAAGSHRNGILRTKAARMRIVGVNGLLVLVPSALILASKASAGQFDGVFVAVQIAELAAGAVNVAMIILNVRDGWRLSGRWRAVTTRPSHGDNFHAVR